MSNGPDRACAVSIPSSRPVGVRIILNPGWDDELIALVFSAKKLNPAIREAMRSGIVKGAYNQLELKMEDLESAGFDLLNGTLWTKPERMSHVEKRREVSETRRTSE